ncbi:MAG: two-component system, response regulator YesN [Clostridiales bacterium]|nr:two-component system, response regulator YesN [Clostridiales bacterium]
MCIKLLIADDEDVIRNGIAKYIKLHTDRFERIYLAQNGEEAMDIIFRHKPDIMLMDVQMPIKNGLEVMREAKKSGILPKTIILSGYDEFAYAQQAVRFGAKDYLLKPSRSSDILHKIHALADEIEGNEKEEGLSKEEVKNGLVEQAREYMEEQYFNNLTLQSVSDQIGITPGYLSTLFTQSLGCGFVDYLNEIRIQHACAYLKQNYFKTYEIAFKVGFRDEKYFSKVFKKIIGMSPSEYKKGREME